MKGYLVCFLAQFLLAELASAQESKKTEGSGDPRNISITTDQEPFFPGGDHVLYKTVFNSISYSEEARQSGLNGQVELSFDVNPDSTVSNVVIIAGPGMGVNEQVKNILEHLRFAPAIQNGMRTRMNVMMNFPVRAH